MLAVFCRTCGSHLPDSAGQWTGFQGGADRRGLNPRILPQPLSQLAIEEVTSLALEGPCLDLLFYDGFLIALSTSGVIEATRLDGSDRSVRWMTGGGEVSAHACVAHGVLYAAGERRLTAHSLAGLEESPPQIHELWGIALDGVPAHALLTVGDRLYLSLGLETGVQRVLALEGLNQKGPPKQETLHEDEVVSPLVASAVPGAERVFFFSQGEGQLALHSISRDGASGPWKKHRRAVKAPGRLQEHRVVAAIGTKVYAVAGEDDLLCRFDADHGLFEEHLCSDTRAFALSGVRAGVAVQTGGLCFLPEATTEATADVLQGHPVILRERAVGIGLGDGRLRLHDLRGPAAVIHRRVSDRRVTVVASAEGFVAAGAEDGVVRLWKLVEQE